MKKNRSTIILILIFLVGLSVMLYPTVSDYVNQRHQSRALASYDETVNEMSDADYTAYFEAADAYNQRLAATPNSFFTPEQVSGYDETLSIGTITCAGSLSVLIPPSVPIISFSLLAGVSIGKALVCGISTGIVFALLMMLMIVIIGAVKPSLIPARETTKVPMREKIGTLKLLLPIIALFALIVGGSFAGWFPATVGGAVAVVAILIYCIARRLPAKEIFAGIMEGTSSFANVYLIIVAGQFFSRFVTVTGLAESISLGIATVNMSPYLVF